jgi:hypothetical protein
MRDEVDLYRETIENCAATNMPIPILPKDVELFEQTWGASNEKAKGYLKQHARIDRKNEHMTALVKKYPQYQSEVDDILVEYGPFNRVANENLTLLEESIDIILKTMRAHQARLIKKKLKNVPYNDMYTRITTAQASAAAFADSLGGTVAPASSDS